ELGPMVDYRTRRTYLGAQPSKKAMEQIRKKTDETLRRGRNESWAIIRDELNRVLRGWASYFAYGSPHKAFRLVAAHVTERAHNLLRRRHRLPRGTARFGHAELHGELGVLDLPRSLRKSHA